MTRVMSIPEVAERLGIHAQTVRALIKRRELGSVRVGGRLGSTTEQVDRYIETHTIDPEDDARDVG